MGERAMEFPQSWKSQCWKLCLFYLSSDYTEGKNICFTKQKTQQAIRSFQNQDIQLTKINK